MKVNSENGFLVCSYMKADCSKKFGLKNKYLDSVIKVSLIFYIYILALEIIDLVSNDTKDSLISTARQFFTDIY